jgi:hypothetical protein
VASLATAFDDGIIAVVNNGERRYYDLIADCHDYPARRVYGGGSTPRPARRQLFGYPENPPWSAALVGDADETLQAAQPGSDGLGKGCLRSPARTAVDGSPRPDGVVGPPEGVPATRACRDGRLLSVTTICEDEARMNSMRPYSCLNCGSVVPWPDE